MYTTFYPSGRPYWSAFLESLARQPQEDLTVWVGVDGLDPAAVRDYVQTRIRAPVSVSSEGGSPTAVRCRALRKITAQHAAVVLVDSDDVLLPTRIARARAAIQECDLVACGLALVDATGVPLGRNMEPDHALAAVESIPYMNGFGFSNTVYRSSTLRSCLPHTDDVDLLDWYTATAAWLQGARMAFDPAPGMSYRQHSANTASPDGPFTPDRIKRDLLRVLQHYTGVLAVTIPGAIPERMRALTDARKRVAEYVEAINARPAILLSHANTLQFEKRVPLWWEWVTRPLLPDLLSNGEME